MKQQEFQKQITTTEAKILIYKGRQMQRSKSNPPIITVEEKVPWLINFKYIILQNGQAGFVALCQQTKKKKLWMQTSQMFRRTLKFLNSCQQRSYPPNWCLKQHNLFLEPLTNTNNCNPAINNVIKCSIGDLMTFLPSNTIASKKRKDTYIYRVPNESVPEHKN
jgi:hypothetical protein